MKKLVFAAVLGLASPAFAQMMNGQPPPAPPQQMPAQPTGQFAPDMVKGPDDTRNLEAAIKADNDAWDRQDVQRILSQWLFPATVVTTDPAGNPIYVQVDGATMGAALTAMFAGIPKPGPGQKAAEIKFGGKDQKFVSHTLATVMQQANLTQGAGKTQYKKVWKVSQIWSRDAQGWHVRGYVASGWGDLLRH